MCNRNDDPTTYDEQALDADVIELGFSVTTYDEHQAEVTQFVAERGRLSPWVKRNEDHAQYAQPRGSQYEG
jgi:hypothetical protein